MDQRATDLPPHTPAEPAVEPAHGTTVPAVTPTEDPRLSEIAERGLDILKQWTVAGERHERAVSQLESQLSELEMASARMQRDAAQRLRDLEQVVQHEWTALRDVHEEPIRQLREQAASLTEVCIATAHSAQRGFDQAEARLAAIETDLQQRLLELRREVQAIGAELRANPGLARLGAAQPAWSLDEVTRLHHQLRQGGEAAEPQAALGPGAGPLTTVIDAPAQPVAAEPAALEASTPAPAQSQSPDLSMRMRALERALEDREGEARRVEERASQAASRSRMAWGALVLVLMLAAAFGWWSQTQTRAQVEEARRRQQAATEEAARQMAATREAAAKEIAAARDLATQAQIVSAVLAAPDLIRYGLGAAGEGATGSAQVLWSRTRGLVFSGSRLVPVPEGSAYQVWLITRGAAVSAGVFTPDASGSATMVVAPPTAVPVIGVVVTQEPAGGSPSPRGRLLLARYPIQS